MSRIDDAMRTVAREAFLPEKQKGSAGFDIALPIGGGSTCSQPTTVRTMLELLDPVPGNNVLDVGSGSGWTTASLCPRIRGSVPQELVDQLAPGIWVPVTGDDRGPEASRSRAGCAGQPVRVVPLRPACQPTRSPLSADRDRPSVVVTAATRVFVSRGSFLIAVNRTDRPRPRCARQ